MSSLTQLARIKQLEAHEYYYKNAILLIAPCVKLKYMPVFCLKKIAFEF